MDISKPIIICGSGNSIPFLNSRYNHNGFKHGLDTKLEEIIKNNYSVGLNFWFKYGCETTFNSSVDWQWYVDNLKDLEKIPMIIANEDCQLKNSNKSIIHSNTYLLPHSGIYQGKDSWTKGFFSRQLVGIWALTLAITLGFKEIYLLGFDCCEINNQTHFYQGVIDLNKHTSISVKGVVKNKRMHFRGIGKNSKGTYNTSTYNHVKHINEKWYKPFLQEKDANIYNVSTDSALKLFPRLSYDQFYKQIGDNKINQEEARQDIKNILKEKLK